jgi:hypothetical protein
MLQHKLSFERVSIMRCVSLFSFGKSRFYSLSNDDGMIAKMILNRGDRRLKCGMGL